MLKKNFSLYIKLLFFFYFLLGLLIYKDFGVGIEEHFHRQNGFYWLIQILNLFQLTISVLFRLKRKISRNSLSSTLPDINIFNLWNNFRCTISFYRNIFFFDLVKFFLK